MRIVYFGTPDFAVASLKAIAGSAHEVAAVVTVPDRPSGRGQKMVCSPVKQYALDHGLPLLQPEKLRAPHFLDALRAFGAEAFVVVAFRMLPEVVWAMPPRGTFNLHASLLPRYRGAAPINWAIINGESHTGVTTFLLNERIDDGNILLQQTTPIAPDDNAGTLHDRLADIGSRLVVQTLDGLEAGSLTPRPQVGDICPAPKIFKDDCRIRFDQGVRRTVDFIRGLSPYPAAHFAMRRPDGTEVLFKVFEATAEPASSSVAGTLVSDNKKVIKLGLSDGFVNILSLQMSGKRKNSTEEFLRGNNITDWELIV